MKTIRRLLLLSSIVCAFTASPLRAEDEIEKVFRDALYAEEVKGDAETALKAYQEVGAKFEQQRDMAATALFRQGECLRKLGRKDEAAVIYNKVLAQYPDKERFARLSRESLAALGRPATARMAETAPIAANNTEIARLEKLLKDSPDLINATDSSNPLAGAAETGQVELVDYLLKKGARVDTLVDGKTALHRAAEAGHLTICQRLLDKGADVNLKSVNATPLIVALDKGRFAVADLLLDRKADPNAGFLTVTKKEEFNNAPVLRLTHEFPALSLALMRRAPAALVMRLLEAGADPARPGLEWSGSLSTKTWPLAEAIRRREPDLVAAILAKGFPVNQAVSGGDWPMDIAMSNAQPSSPDATDDAVVEALRKHGADLKRDQVIYHAVRLGFTGYIRAAVKDGASPQQVEPALRAKRPEVVKVLLELGADPAKKDEHEYDALWWAISHGSPEALEVILASSYPLAERLAGATAHAASYLCQQNEKRGANAQAIFDFFREKAEKAGVLTEAMTRALDNCLTNGGSDADSRILLRNGADAWKAESVRRLFQDQTKKFGIPRPDFTPLWKAARILNNPQLRSAIWASRGPALTKYLGGSEHVFNQSNTHYRPFFRAVISEKGIVPPGTLGRFLVAYGWNVHTDELTNIVVSRFTEDGAIHEQVLDFVAIAKAGDVSKDYPLQWGDVIEIEPSYFPSPGSDSTADQRRKEILETVTGFMDTHYREIEVGMTIGDDQILTNAENEKGPVLRVPAGMEPFSAAGLPMNTDPLPLVEIMRPGDEAFTLYNRSINPLARHGDRIRIVPPPRDPSLSDEALRDAFTLAVSDKGPFLRIYQASMGELKGSHQVRGRPLLDLLPVTKWRLRDILFMLHSPNPFGFGPVNWPAARCKLAGKDAWEELPLSEASLDWPVVPGTILILPPLDPSSPVPPNDFDYAACAIDYEVAIGDQPPVKRRYQPPVPELKRAGDKWLWSWKRNEGDSRFAWPDLGAIISELPEVKDWPGWNGFIKYHEGDPPLGSIVPGLWLRKEWKGIRLDKAIPNAIPASAPGVNIPVPIAGTLDAGAPVKAQGRSPAAAIDE